MRTEFEWTITELQPQDLGAENLDQFEDGGETRHVAAGALREVHGFTPDKRHHNLLTFSSNENRREHASYAA